MNDDPQPDGRTTVYTFDRHGRRVHTEELTGEEFEALGDRLTDSPDRPPFRFEHDPAARVYRLTAADGIVEVFRDTPRFLCVEPDPETGEMRPVMKLGRPVYLHLCREEPEAR